MIRKSPGVMGLVLLSAAAAWAGPVNPRAISGQAKWLVHVDVEQLVGSTFGARVVAEARARGAEAKLAAFEAVFSFNPLRDLKSVTLYGPEFIHGCGVALIHGNFDRERLLTLLRANDVYSEATYENQTLYRWVDDKSGKKMTGTFYGADLAVVSEQQALVEQALDVLKGKADNLTVTKGFLAAQMAPPAGTWCVVAAERFAAVAANQPKAAVLQKAEALAATLGQNGPDVVFSAQLMTGTPEIALQVQQILQGLVAIGQLAADQHPDAAAIAQRVRIAPAGKSVGVSVAYPVDELFAVMKKKCERYKPVHTRPAP